MMRRVPSDHRPPAVSGEVLPRSRAIDPPKVRTVSGNPRTAHTGREAALASSFADPYVERLLTLRNRLIAVDVVSCRVCGCTDEQACEGGCVWVEDPEGLGDLCSSCLETLPHSLATGPVILADAGPSFLRDGLVW